MVAITDRPPEVETRIVVGDWEGDLVMGRRPTAIATLVERTSRMTRLVALPDGIKCGPVRLALTRDLEQVDPVLRRTLTWDRGREMAEHAQLTEDTGCQVYFSAPENRGNAARTRTRTACCGNTWPRPPTSALSIRPLWTPSPRGSIIVPGQCWVGKLRLRCMPPLSLAGPARDKITSVDDLIEQCVEQLKVIGTDLRPGLTRNEIAGLEGEFGFTFSPDHAALLAAFLPTGEGWVDWRQVNRDDIRSRLEWPTYGVVSDVEHDSFWPASWGPRPNDLESALTTARLRMASVPTLVPIYSHRYMPAAPAVHLAPVFSVYHTDVIYYGNDLLDYLAQEFRETWSLWRRSPELIRTHFWSDLAEGAENASL